MNKINSLQVLRAVAVCAVVWGHCYARAVRTWPQEIGHSPIFGLSQFPLVGYFGVDLFFVLSGFLMAYLHADAFGKPKASGKFFTRRLTRIVPAYWILSTLGLVLLFVAPKLFTYHKGVELPWLVGVYAFVPWPMSDGFSEPILGAGWTLNFEMYFYLLFALALSFKRQYALPALYAFFVLSVGAGLVFNFHHPWAQVVTGWLLLEFLMGLIIATALRKYTIPKPIAWGGLAASAVAILATANHQPAQYSAERVLLWGVPAAVMLASTVSLGFKCESKWGRFWVTLGDASYSIYLVQVFSMPLLSFVFRAIHLQKHLPIDVVVFLVFVGSCALGTLFWWLVERRVTEHLKTRLSARQNRATVPASA